jgi:hypothetical protein
MKDLKKHLPLIIAFALPFIFIMVVALSVYIPNLSVKTDYSFMYAVCDRTSFNNYCHNYLQQRYKVQDNALQVQTLTPDSYESITKEELNNQFAARLYVHNTQTNESREITLDEAKTLSLNTLSTSPDGFTIDDRYSGSIDVFPFFGSGGNRGIFLTQGSKRKKMHVVDGDQYYARFTFLGWLQ